MAKKLSREEFLQNLRDSRLFSPQELDSCLEAAPEASAADGEALARLLITSGKLTPFQAAAVYAGRLAELVIGNYQVLDRLGAGGMGTVYKARHRRMKRVVAIKVLSRKVSQSEEFVRRFQREVEAVARLSHSNIVMAHDADEAEVGHFLVMEFVNGRDLATEVQQRGPLPVPEAVACLVQAARALDYAHRQGIIHRDIKPANLLRDVSGVVKVADLGLARVSNTLGESPPDQGALTQAGTIMGTVDFMPPEQALGLTGIDHRADVYSLGCTLHFLLTGKPPYQGATLMATLLQHREAPPPSLCAARGDVPAALDQIFRRMLAKKPEERFASMAEVVAALEALALVPAPHSQPAGLVPEAAPPPAPVEIAPQRQETVSLPSPPEPVSQTVDLRPAATGSRGGPAVLLVEPSRSQAVIIRGFLQKLGFHDVPTAPSGQKALELARAAPPGVIVSAMHLADMTGVQLARQVRAEAPLAATGFVLITSQAEVQEADSPSQAGDLVRLPKPFDAEHLAQALAAARRKDEGGRLKDESERKPSDSSFSLPPSSLKRVLVVDDSAAARSHVRRVLAGLGLSHITEAADGAEARALLEKGAFDLVVTDYHMPRLDGRGLLEFIRQRTQGQDVPVILVTTETDPALLAAMRQIGVSAICDKSFPAEAVRAALQTLG
jgi:serine/threonine protein kinase/DNA-binding response OmpR family regulator